jgi:hypothetical protein
MRHKILGLLFVVAVILTLLGEGGTVAQPPGKKGDGGDKVGKKGGGKKGGGGSATVDQIVERIMALDKNGDGKITIDELPERMQHLVALGDTNKDGVLDRDEVTALATTLESFVVFVNPGGKGGPKGGPKGGFKGDFPGGPFAVSLVQAVDDLNLSAPAKEKAVVLVKDHQAKVRKLEDDARIELLNQMKAVLKDDEYKAFKAVVDRQPGPPAFAGAKSDLEKRLDQLQQDLDELKRSVKK